MITPGYAATMAAYNSEMNRRVYGAALRLTDEQRRAEGGAFWHSIHGTLNHLLWVDRVWLSRFGVGERPSVPMSSSDRLVADFDDLWTQRQSFDDAIIGWANHLVAEDLDGDLAWVSGGTGRPMVKPKALCVIHLFNHQTHHRGQAHALITRAGEAIGDTDLPWVVDHQNIKLT
ncbi:DinB family protein [Rubellimicrobium mesophilum DSM 19309]|uniref:DinB family protein n=1 Tax=Rubellimicrobium mesophilum DSM 19309 TaxID=442562 RepID=A0A017HMM6_9RHOB|nr:DinB family protein [Rubellimicrobium mesophilum]EYD75606.1 DinB family protein [Rubellimicrobium mesophilum DSM 19309]